jgi:transcriptional regulator with GAF, ATPase, and Fis domain
MAKVRLKRLLSQKIRGAAILHEIESLTSDITIVDANHKILLREGDGANKMHYPILFDEHPIGWVIGDSQAELVATLLAYLAHKEAESGDLADELLGLYREINLLFHLSEKLSTSLDVNDVAKVAIQEANQLIKATSGAVILREGDTELFKNRHIFGQEFDLNATYALHEGIIGELIIKPDGEIINDVPSDRRYSSQDGNFESLICAPLKVKQEVIGILMLVNQEATMYTSPDLMLLTTVASQAAPAIANALLHEKTIAEGKKRETQLQLQIRQLQLELDEASVNKAVTEIVETDYFKRIREQSQDLRQIFDSDENSGK